MHYSGWEKLIIKFVLVQLRTDRYYVSIRQSSNHVHSTSRATSKTFTDYYNVVTLYEYIVLILLVQIKDDRASNLAITCPINTHSSYCYVSLQPCWCTLKTWINGVSCQAGSLHSNIFSLSHSLNACICIWRLALFLNFRTLKNAICILIQSLCQAVIYSQWAIDCSYIVCSCCLF